MHVYKHDPSINIKIGHGDSHSNVSLPESSFEVETMASASHSSHKRLEDAEIFQVLEESTDSDVTIFSSEEDEDGNEPDSDEDGQLDENCETNEDGGTRTSGPKTPHLNGLIP
jgi:hypothetical protein